MTKYPTQIGVGGLVISEEEKQLVAEVLATNRLTYGPYSKKFESQFASHHDARHAIFTNSGTSSLHIALAALKERYGWADGDEVLVPSVTFVATSNIVLHNNMVPVFVEVDSRTYNIDPNEIEAKITPRTKAIIPVHLLGLPADMDPIIEIAKARNLKIIEDSAECMFARYKGKSVGSMGDIGCFSTYAAHILTTGVGGFAITNDDDLAVDLRSLMNHGRDNIYISCDDDEGKAGEELHTIIERRFSFVHVGHSFRCTELESALGLGQLANVDKSIARRREIAKMYIDGLAEFSDRIQLPYTPEDREHSFMVFGLTLHHENKRNLINFLEDRNIETRDMFPLLTQPIYKSLFGDIHTNFPVTEWISNSAFYIGSHPFMHDDEVHFVIESFRDYFKNN